MRQKAGALAFDLPRLLWALNGPAGLGAHWTRYRNRGDRIAVRSGVRGVDCEWVDTRDLHVCRVFPGLGRSLLAAALREHPVRLATLPGTPSAPAVSFLIGHRGAERVPLLLQVLASIAGQQGVACESIVAEQDVVSRLEGVLPDGVRHVFCPVADPAVPFSRARAFNAAARLARGPLWVLHDNDLLVPQDYAAEAVRCAATGAEVVNHKRFVFYLSAVATTATLAGGPGTVPAPADGVAEVVENATGGGSLVIRRETFAAIGGLDESFEGWGGEDVEFWQRAATRRVWSGGYLPLLHLWHPAQPGKFPAKRTPGMARLAGLAVIPPEERIRKLRQARAEA